MTLEGKDNPKNEYRVYSTNHRVRCGVCAFIGDQLNGFNRQCVLYDQPTNPFATCNKFRPDNPARPEDKSNAEWKS